MSLSPEQYKFLAAATQGDAPAVRAMLAAGVDVNTPDNRSFPRNRTALMHAAEHGHMEVVEMLLAAGAKVDVKDVGFGVTLPGGNTALLLALKSKHARIGQKLLAAGASPRVTSGGATVFGLAANLGDVALVRQLLDLGVSPNQVISRRADLPLASALFARQTAVVRLLVASKVNPNARGAGGLRPLEIAVREGLDEAVQLLLHHGANPNFVSAKGFTPLMTAVLNGQKEIVKILLDRDTRLNRRNKRGLTALDIAQQELDKRLAEAATPSLQRRGVDLAGEVKLYEEFIALLRNHGAKSAKELAAKPRTTLPTTPALGAAEPPDPTEPIRLGAKDFLELVHYAEPEFSVVAVKAPLQHLAEAFREFRNAREWLPDVPRRVGKRLRHVNAAVVALVELDRSPWTVIFRSLFRVGREDYNLVVEDARELSVRLRTNAVVFLREETARAVGYQLFERGRLSEQAQWIEDGSVCWFKSRFNRRPKKGESGEEFAERVFRQQGLYLPACFPQRKKDEAWLCVEKVSAKAIRRADVMILPRRKSGKG